MTKRKPAPWSQSMADIFAEAEDEVAWYREHCEIVPTGIGTFTVRRKQATDEAAPDTEEKPSA